MSTNVYPVRKKGNKLAAFRLIFIELGLLVALIIPIVLLLNYFRIITVPSLPQKPAVSVEQKRDIAVYNAQPILYACPLEAKLCTTGKQIYDTKERKISGFGYSSLPKGTKILAAFDGTYEMSSEKDGKNDVITLTLTDTKNENIVIYKFVGTPVSTTGTVKQKDVIGTTNGEASTLTDFNKVDYSLYVKVKNKTIGQELPLKPSLDGIGLSQ